MTRMRRSGLMAVGIWLVAADSAPADTVHTTDGSRFVGTIEQMSGGKLVMVTEIAGRLVIDASKIVAVATDRAINVEFASGDRLVGTVEVSDDLSTSTVHTAFGDILVTADQITSIWPEGTQSPDLLAVKAEAEAQVEAMRPDWTMTLEAGGNATDGNTDTLQAHGRLDIIRKTPNDLLNLYLAAQYYEQNDRRSTNEYRGGVRFENSITDRWFWYVRTELEFDEFEDLDLRATAAAGGGYYWLKQPDHELKTSLGIGYRHESYDTGRTDNAAVLDLGLNYRHDIAEWVHFTHAAVYSPDFLEFNDYRLDLDTALVFPMQHERWKLKLGVRNEYNSRPQPGFDRLDNTYYTSVVLELKR